MKKIIEFPCSKGDKIYLVDKIFKRIKTGVVEHIEYIENTNADFPFTMIKGSIIDGDIGKGFGFSIFFDDFNKIAFETEEEANKKLNEILNL